MAKLGSVWRCSHCGNAVMVIKAGSNPRVGCCGKAMKRLKVRFR